MTKATSEAPTVYLVDGSGYIYRAFYAIRELTNSKGFPTNAIYGFTNMLMRLCRQASPEYIAVVFDSRGPTFRHEMFHQYKAHRKAMPEELVVQVPYIKEIVRALSIPLIEKEGIEADDVIGTAVLKLSRQGIRSVIVSGDKDLMQLVSKDAIMIDTMKDKRYDIDAVKERFGVEPDKVVEVLGLAGDTSDNIPGVPGIGEKTAMKLVREYGSVESVLEHIDEIKGTRLRENLAAFAEQARMSRELARIVTDADLSCELGDFRVMKPNEAKLKDLFTEFEFSSLIQKIKVEEENGENDYRVVKTEAEAIQVFASCEKSAHVSFDLFLTSEDAMGADIVGIALSTEPNKGWYFPFTKEPQGIDVGGNINERIVMGMKKLFSDSGIGKTTYDLKTAIIVLARQGIHFAGELWDVMIASYMVNPSKRTFDFSEIAREHLSREMQSLKDLMKKEGKGLFPFDLSPDDACPYACRRSDYALRLRPVLAAKLDEAELSDLFYSMEMPLVSVLAEMERCGVLIDRDILRTISKELEDLMAISERRIFDLAGEEFNINSPKQLQEILFDKLGLPRGKKTKAGYSTDIEVLSSLARSFDLPAEILSYRSFTKLKSTYVDALPELINPETGRVHTSYNQTVTATGRLSSSNPNLQNIPIRTEEGRRIRRAFCASEGKRIVSADYSQIELRILAHLSEDDALLDAFASDEDVHRRTASNIFGVFPEMVNSEMRRQAKVINFGIIYGMSPFGLAKELGITQKTAKVYIDEYFRKYEGVKDYIDGLLEKTRKDKYVRTMFNRRRYIADIDGKNGALRQFAERTAINTPIQGSAADIIKVAMLAIASRLSGEGFASRMIMQVHDELVFEAPEAEVDSLMDLVRKEMEGVVEMKAPLRVEIYQGKNWDEAH